MIRTRSLTVALIAALLLPAAASAQQDGQRGGMGGMMAARNLIEQGSVEFLLAQAPELQLTAGQTAALKAIADRWSAATKESRERLRALLPQGGQGMAGMGGTAGVDREALQQLDDTQKATSRHLIEERNRPRRQGPSTP